MMENTAEETGEKKFKLTVLPLPASITPVAKSTRVLEDVKDLTFLFSQLTCTEAQNWYRIS